ncbi:hypothetical protein [Geitlerinema sp. PCC 9228]|uniref:hypothetical protein n=1 Tax=Geitlerinema sp. PCC 9228 TaxID=111611 RepID=UPI00147D213F|nr:hypothetical protein [Geitlerinema sp. PCC 9228]
MKISYLFWTSLGITLLVWFLRGIRVLSFLPGYVIWIFILVTISLGIISYLQR